MNIKLILSGILFVLIFVSTRLSAQIISKSFELRYFTDDSKANDETDFKGETDWLNTDQRIQFLNAYADYASIFFENDSLDKQAITNNEVEKLLSAIKPQPLTRIRKTIPLETWRSYGYAKEQESKKMQGLQLWQDNPGIAISKGMLNLNDAKFTRSIDSLTWRFMAQCQIKVSQHSTLTISFTNDYGTAIFLTVKNGYLRSKTGEHVREFHVEMNEWINLKIEGDLPASRFNLYVNNRSLMEYVPMAENGLRSITGLSMDVSGKAQVDEIFIYNHKPTDNIRAPYGSSVVLDEDFEEKPNVTGWQEVNFNDNHWTEVTLPAVHGGLREKNEDMYLRKKIHIGSFDRATMAIETLDPGGEVWVNNQIVKVIIDKYPQVLDLTPYLLKDQDNILAVRVKSNQLKHVMTHTPTDHHIGWFLGRTALLLSSECMIKDVQITTKQLKGNEAVQSHKLLIQYPTPDWFEGSVEINYSPWFPNEGNKVAVFSHKVQVRPRINNEYIIEGAIPSAELWSAGSPQLYKVEVVLKDREGKPVDDYVITTGIRTIEQSDGELLINNKAEMLNGAQNMGFRMPLETIAKYHRSAPIKTIAEELLMIKKMNGNLLRMHVHASNDQADGINDPRYAELADQMGIYLIWTTAAWTRTTEAWNVDFEGYPQYMKQVYNHPSIVIWEAANHPKFFRKHGISDTHDYVEKIVRTISSEDQSRLISPTTVWRHTHYGNYDGTIDHEGNPITPVAEFMHKMVTRGAQDAYTGYGNDWTVIRTAPYDFAASCLNARDKAYFNFEHEESIGQPNWNLCKGKPWYLMQSYEWEYDEGSIGRRLSTDEWRASQAWQAFAAWESMKKQILLGYDGFSWCSLRGGANMGTYKKPLIDNLGHPKLAYYTNKMIFQNDWAASDNVDVVYGPEDQINPVINHLGQGKQVNLIITLKDLEGRTLDEKTYNNVTLQEGHVINRLNVFSFKKVQNGIYAIEYKLLAIK